MRHEDVAAFQPPIRIRSSVDSRRNLRDVRTATATFAEFTTALRKDLDGLAISISAYVDEPNAGVVDCLLACLDSPHDTVWVIGPGGDGDDVRAFGFDFEDPLHSKQMSLLVDDAAVLASERALADLARIERCSGGVIIDARITEANELAQWSLRHNIPTWFWGGGSLLFAACGEGPLTTILQTVSTLIRMPRADSHFFIPRSIEGLCDPAVGAAFTRTLQVLATAEQNEWPRWALEMLSCWYVDSPLIERDGAIVAEPIMTCLSASWMREARPYGDSTLHHIYPFPAFADVVRLVGRALGKSLAQAGKKRSVGAIYGICSATLDAISQDMVHRADVYNYLRIAKRLLHERSLAAA